MWNSQKEKSEQLTQRDCANWWQNGERGIVRGLTLLRATKDKKLWRAMITHLLKVHGIYKKLYDGVFTIT